MHKPIEMHGNNQITYSDMLSELNGVLTKPLDSMAVGLTNTTKAKTTATTNDSALAYSVI